MLLLLLRPHDELDDCEATRNGHEDGKCRKYALEQGVDGRHTGCTVEAHRRVCCGHECCKKQESVERCQEGALCQMEANLNRGHCVAQMVKRSPSHRFFTA